METILAFNIDELSFMWVGTAIAGLGALSSLISSLRGGGEGNQELPNLGSVVGTPPVQSLAALLSLLKKGAGNEPSSTANMPLSSNNQNPYG